MKYLAVELSAQVRWAELAEGLRARKLLPSLGPRIIELAGGLAIDEFSAAVDQSVAAASRHGSFLQLLSTRAIGMLADQGVRSAALKGPMLGEAIYGEPGRRLSSDIDLLVPSEQLQAAVDVIRLLGYGPPADYVEESGLPLLHFVLVHEGGELPAVELHWRVHWYEISFARERLLPPEIDPSGGWRAEPAAELIALLLFYARDGFAGLRQATDISAWWDAFGADLPPDAVPGLLRAYPALARAIRGAAEAAHATVGLPAAQIIGSGVKVGARERLAARLADPSPRSSEAQLYADMGLIDGLLTPTGGLRAFVGRQLLPPAEVLDEQSRHASRARARSPRLASLECWRATAPRCLASCCARRDCHDPPPAPLLRGGGGGLA